MKKVLLLEDDENFSRALGQEFTEHGYEVTALKSIKELTPTRFDYAVVDLRLAGEFGLEAVRILKEKLPEIRILVLSGYVSISTAVEAVKRGAVNYLAKPASFAAIEAALLGKAAPATELKTPSLSQMEHEYIDFVLTRNNGNISKTAKDLGILRQSLQRKLKKYS
jgi:two-component system response regulator RegA